MRTYPDDVAYEFRLETEIMRLAMIAIDIRSKVMPHDLARVPSLIRALEAWDDVVAELGWSEPRSPSPLQTRRGTRARVMQATGGK